MNETRPPQSALSGIRVAQIAKVICSSSATIALTLIASAHTLGHAVAPASPLGMTIKGFISVFELSGGVMAFFRAYPDVKISTAAELASVIAGRARRPHLREEWLDHLNPAGAGTGLSRRKRCFYAAGFIFAAVRMRVGDLLGPLWRPVDWVLRSDSRVNGAVTCCGGAVTVYLIRSDGLAAFLGVDCLGVGVIGAGAFTLLRWLRKVRGIELAELAKPGKKPTGPPAE